MANLEASKICHGNMNHLLLDQPLLRLPYELLRKNFRQAHLVSEKESKFVKDVLKETATGSLNGQKSPQDVADNLDSILKRMKGLKRKLETSAGEEERLYRQMDARVAHLSEINQMHTVEDVKYEAWSRQRLDRLLVDYLLRLGYNESAIALADEQKMRVLVDIDTFMAMTKIRKSIESGSLAEALAYCIENKKELRKQDSKLEFMLRSQHYIELVRKGTNPELGEAINYAKKFLAPQAKAYPMDVSNLAGLLAYRADTRIEPYASLYSPKRWVILADHFVKTHNELLGLPPFPVLHIALSSGLSALKTPACHSSHTTSSSHPSASTSLMASVCPICSTELNKLARKVPYAHHGTSHVEHDLLLLPNGRVYGKERLDEYAIKAGLGPDLVKDLVTGDLYTRDSLKKVFIT